MRQILSPYFLLSLALLAACANAGEETGKTDHPDPPGDSGDSAEAGDSGETGDSGEMGDSGETGDVVDSFGLELSVDVHVAVMLHATWVDPGSTDSWVEYRYADGDWQIAPSTSPGAAVLLGIPAERNVQARVAAVVGGETLYSDYALGATEALPVGLDLPTIVTYDPALVSDAPYVMVAVAGGPNWYDGPYYIEIFDRAGRMVWYRNATTEAGLITLSASASRDGTHIWYEDADVFGFVPDGGTVTRTTLDGRWSVTLPAPDLGQGIAEGPDGSFFLEHRAGDSHGVDQMDDAGTITSLWGCDARFGELGLSTGLCLMNAVNWDETTNTVLASQFETSTIFEVDVATGEVVRQMGALTAGEPYTFDPPESNFAYQHFPHWTPAAPRSERSAPRESGRTTSLTRGRGSSPRKGTGPAHARAPLGPSPKLSRPQLQATPSWSGRAPSTRTSRSRRTSRFAASAPE